MAAIAFYVDCEVPGSAKEAAEFDTFEEAMEWFRQRLKPGNGGSGRLIDRMGRLTKEQKAVLDGFNIRFR